MSVVTDLLVPGTTLPEWSVPLTPTVIVSTAIATRDFQDVHHDRDVVSRVIDGPVSTHVED